MNYTTLSSWGPEKTPASIRQLIIAISVVAILCATLQSIFDQFGIFPGPQNFLSLSWWGISHGYIWQPLTFLFIQDIPGGLSFFFFIILFFNMYLLWIIGSSVFQMLGKGAFLRLYFIGGISAGLLTLLSMKVTGQYEMLTGITPTLLILFTVWSMAFPEREILLFFLIPVKVKWMIVSLAGALLLISLSRLDISDFILYLSAISIGYTYAVAIHGWYSPFPLTLKFDLWLSRVAAFIRRKMPFPKRKPEDVKTPTVKIVDISSGQRIEDDDAFVDAMLTKISKRGEESLTWSERKRLQDISLKKMKE